MCKEAWAWEFTRRNVKYINAWKQHLLQCTQIGVNELESRFNKCEMDIAAKFGLLFFIDPTLNANLIDIFWSPQKMPYILKCSLIEHNHNFYNEGIILADLELRLICVETFDGLSHLLLKDRHCSLQLIFNTKLDLNTFFDFEIHIPAFCNFSEQIQSAKHLEKLLEYKQYNSSQRISSTKTRQYIEILYVHDLLEIGLRQRDIARNLFGEVAVTESWNGINDYARTRMRRIISRGRILIKSGCSTFFKT